MRLEILLKELAKEDCVLGFMAGQMRTVFGDHKDSLTLFSQFDGKYFTGDGVEEIKTDIIG